ncbi:MAG: hypothetical protein JWR80_8722 [Bradyrhizobium sp.]|nr:hypothetical protein [Bradyrhizobium sp.]
MATVQAPTMEKADSLRPMPGEPRSLGLYPGWTNVIASVVVSMLVVGATSYSFGLFVKPVSENLGIGRASIALGLILFHLGSALFSPFVGRIVDRNPARLVTLVSGALAGGGLIVVGLSSSLLLMAFCILLPVALGTVGATTAVMVLVSRWFTRLRGRALSISALGTSFGGLVTFPVVAMLIGRFGWRSALIITGVGIWSVLWLLALMLREAPVKSGIPAIAVEAQARDWTFLALVRERDFWLIALSLALMLGVDQALLGTITPWAQDRAYSLTAVTLLTTVMVASAIVGKLVIAWLADRTDLRLLIGVTGLCGTLLCTTLLLNPSYGVLIGVLSLTGLAIGGTYPLSNAIVAQRFGVVSLGLARGLMMPISSIFASVCLFAAGKAYDLDKAYTRAFGGFIVATIVAIVLIALVRRPISPIPTRLRAVE